MSWKEEFIERHGEEAYDKHLEQKRQEYKAKPDKVKAWVRQWQEANPGKMEEYVHSQCRKGGKGYEKKLKYEHTGLLGERNKIRSKHARMWRQYKSIIAPGSQLHHQWRPGTSEYSGLALVEADPHMHGIIDVIRILDGEITVFTEKELRERGGM